MHRLRRIELEHFALRGPRYAERIAARSQHEVHLRVRDLQVREKDLRRRVVPQPVGSTVLDDADDLVRIGAACRVIDDDAFADGVLAGPELLRQPVVDDGDGRRIGIVLDP